MFQDSAEIKIALSNYRSSKKAKQFFVYISFGAVPKLRTAICVTYRNVDGPPPPLERYVIQAQFLREIFEQSFEFFNHNFLITLQPILDSIHSIPKACYLRQPLLRESIGQHQAPRNNKRITKTIFQRSQVSLIPYLS